MLPTGSVWSDFSAIRNNDREEKNALCWQFPNSLVVVCTAAGVKDGVAVMLGPYHAAKGSSVKRSGELFLLLSSLCLILVKTTQLVTSMSLPSGLQSWRLDYSGRWPELVPATRENFPRVWF